MVFNPAPGGGTSTAAAFTINAANPAPTITSLSPSSASAGGAAFSLTVNGTGFISSSVVNWNGAARSTTYIRATQLTVAIAAADIVSAGTAQVTVFNPAPGGGTSAAAAFTINAPNPVPTITSLSPASTTAGGTDFSLTVNGTGFVNGSVVIWNRSTRTTTYVSATQLTAAITAANIGIAGTVQVMVLNPTEGSGTWSTPVSFLVSDGTNSMPTISSLSPSSATSGGASFSLTVDGTGFVNGSVVNWNGVARATTYVSSKRLITVISAADIASVGTGQVTVFNPAPGGRTSGGRTFSISAGGCGPGRRRSCPPTNTTTSNEPRSIAIPFASEPQSEENASMELSCTPRAITAGQKATCELRTTSAFPAMRVQVTSTSEQTRVPSSMVTRLNQTRLTFEVDVDPISRQQAVTIRAAAGTATAADTIQVEPSPGPIVIVPSARVGMVGKSLHFSATAVDPADLPVRVDATGLPAGASFDPATGRFEWVPSASQSGKFEVTFRATNSAGQSSSAKVTLNVRSGAASVDRSERLMCSPGAIASLSGTGFAELDTALADASGASLALGGTRVKINGQYVPVLSASEDRVTFVCPSLDPGTQLEAVVESNAGTNDPVNSSMQAASPMIFSLDGSGYNQGVISFADTNELAMARNFLVPAHPAQPGDQVLIWGSGFGSLPTEAPTAKVLVKLGGVDAQVDSVRAVPGYAGVYTIQARVPEGIKFSDAVGLQVQVTTPSGKRFNSNQVTLAVEPVFQ